MEQADAFGFQVRGFLVFGPSACSSQFFKDVAPTTENILQYFPRLDTQHRFDSGRKLCKAI
jgi:hypothetical protein